MKEEEIPCFIKTSSGLALIGHVVVTIDPSFDSVSLPIFMPTAISFGTKEVIPYEEQRPSTILLRFSFYTKKKDTTFRRCFFLTNETAEKLSKHGLLVPTIWVPDFRRDQLVWS